MPTFFAVASLAGLDQLRREIGYERALRELDVLHDALVSCLPDTRLRANRTSIEFLIEERDAGAAARRLEGLCRAIGGAIPVRGRKVARRLAVAAVRCPTDVVTEKVVQQAEASLRAAGAADPAVLVTELDQGDRAEHLLMADLRRAIRSDALHLAYQPKMCARGRGIMGAEALARWTHPSGASISPAKFIPAAERSGDIRHLTDWVIDRVVEDSRIVADAGFLCPLHVNISAPLIADSGFVEDSLARIGSLADRIGFEITETAMMVDPVTTLANLHRLADAGMPLSIDDYGSAFSSLSYLQQLPVGEIKIDQMFVSRLTSASRDPLLVRSTIDLAHALEMKVTAEGVEAPAALALLQVMGCDMVQGFLLCPPVPLPDMIAFAGGARDGEAMRAGIGDGRWAKLARRSLR